MNKILKAETILAAITEDTNKGVPILDALLKFCEETGASIDDVASVVKRDNSLLQRVKEDAVSHNLIKSDERDDNLNEFLG